jgi:GntR family transcriptional regulator, transcriptional repressor for pyruvate dehydrogenase complex
MSRPSAEPQGLLDAVMPLSRLPLRFAGRVHEALGQAIRTGRLAAGARLPSEAALASLFQVSRPVVREGLARLREEGLVQSRRGSGTYVCDAAGLPGPGDSGPTGAELGRILHGVELRLVIEPEAAYLAALWRTPADLERLAATVDAFEHATRMGEPTHTHDYGFHEAVASATANPRLLEAVRALESDVSHAVRVWTHWGRMKPGMRMQDAVDEHRAVLGFIRAQDAEAARRAMRSHIEKARVRMMELDPARTEDEAT